ncbi:MAG: hypothetical protein DWB56_03900 [Candidatus Jettenia sp.]|nr:hypothetical protein [Candidatus Jettenia sp.]
MVQAVQAVPAVQEVRIFPIVTHFLGKPVRFFPMTFEIEMRCHDDTSSQDKNPEMGYHNDTPSEMDIRGHNDSQSRGNNQETGSCNTTPSPQEIGYHNDTQSWSRKVVMETQAIPLPDYCTAIGVAENNIRRMINLSKDTFKSFYRVEPIPDALGRIQETIIMAQEMVDGLTFKLHTSRIKDPQTRERVIEFQKWVMIMLGMIRRGQLRPVHVPKDAGIPHQVYDFLALKEYKGRGKFQQQACRELGWSKGKFYRMVEVAEKSSCIPPEATKLTGQPRRPRSDKGKKSVINQWKRKVEYV